MQIRRSEKQFTKPVQGASQFREENSHIREGIPSIPEGKCRLKNRSAQFQLDVVSKSLGDHEPDAPQRLYSNEEVKNLI